MIKSKWFLITLALLLPLLAGCYPPAGPVAPTPNPDVYNVVPDTTVYDAGECMAVLAAPAPAYTSSTLSGAPSGEVPAGTYEVGAVADYGSVVFFMLNGVPAPTNWITSASVASLEGACAEPANPIVDIVWQWTSVRNRSTGQATAVPNPPVYTIIFRDDGTLSGQADCNTFTGTYSTQGGFFITATPDVMAACGGDSLDVQYFELLGDIVAGGPDGAGGLALETAGGEQRMEFANGGAAPQ